MRFRLIRVLGMAVLAAPLLFAGAGPSVAETVRIAGNFAVDHSSSKAMEVFKQELAEHSGGALTADIFPAMQLGGAQENVDQVRSGTVFATWIGIAYLSRTVPELEAVSLPFAFSDRDAAFRVIDGKVGDLLDEKLAEKGFLSLGYMELGSRNVTNNVRPLRTMADFADLKIRLQPNETHLASFKAIGANPVAMGIKEVYSALQQNVLDGQENPYSIIATRRFDEVQKYVSDSGHFFDFIILVANKDRFDALPAEQQQALRDAAAGAVAWQRAKAAEEDAAARVELVKRGMRFDPLPPETRAALQDATAGVVDELKAKIGSEIIDAVLAEAEG
ncbi:TRAP transporter substrate-binding protein [Pelagibius sp.]|uniref:TRAP transporter substrate-binding protein n=1 Tax=Pelagibius sp. TaxID=1931238 RepID=UPI003B50E9B1